jgi:hypothetical protein
MNYIPFPRLDKDSHPDLVAWRSKVPKADGDWKVLKSFLNDCTKILQTNDALSKCWYSEMPQGDDYALDVEHFRPKKSGSPLKIEHIERIEKSGNIIYEQDISTGKYNWLKFDYRNYRLVTAKTNRAGAKHIYFPIAKGTSRLPMGSFPWDTQEFSYFLDPTDKHDTSLLFVKPNGEIAPITPCTILGPTDFAGLPQTWRNDGFNYLRSIVTIKLFRLDNKVFVEARKKVYDDTTRDLKTLEKLFIENPQSTVIEDLVRDLIYLILPSAPFSLAAKSALIAYQPDNANLQKRDFTKIIDLILKKVETELNSINIDWNRP